MNLLLLDLRARLGQRGVKVVLGMMAYAVLGLPFLLERPPAHVTEALRAWFGVDRGFVLFLYLWTDVAMNKLIGLVAVAFAGATLIQERDTGVLPLLRSKPITLPRLFLLRAGSAVLLVLGLYWGTALVAVPWFWAKVEGFRPGIFLLSTLVHSGAAAFATALAALIAVLIRRRTASMVVGLIAIFSLIGGSFVGFYVPEWASVASLNPFAQGVQVVGHLGDLGPEDVVIPLLYLGVCVALTLAAGARAAARMEEEL